MRRKLSDEVSERLKRMITGGEFKPGDEMPSERELMERFGVGRSAIREAMHVISNLGLISISQGERARVIELTAQSIIRQVDQTAHIMLSQSSDSLENLKNARLFFERGMVRDAAMRATPEQIGHLRATLREQRGYLGQADPFINADMKFHSQIAAISGNPIFSAVSEAMLGWLKVYHTELLIWSGKERFTLAEHEEIINLIEAGDANAAEQALIRHLERSRSLYVLGPAQRSS